MIVSWLYCSPATSASQIGLVTVSICSIVGLRNSGAVTGMNSAHGAAWGSAFSSGGAMRIRRSSNPLDSSTPVKDSSITNTMRWPRTASTLAIATQLLVGPQAPGSGKKAMVRASVNGASRDRLLEVGGGNLPRVEAACIPAPAPLPAQTERTLRVVQPGLKSGSPSSGTETTTGSTPSDEANAADSRFHPFRSHDSATSSTAPSAPTATTAGAH